MSAPPYRIRYTSDADKIIKSLPQQDLRKAKKVKNATDRLRDYGPSYPSLMTHKFTGRVGPRGEEIWQSYAENNTPGAWRVWWFYGPGDGELTIIDVGPHS